MEYFFPCLLAAMESPQLSDSRSFRRGKTIIDTNRIKCHKEHHFDLERAAVGGVMKTPSLRVAVTMAFTGLCLHGPSVATAQLTNKPGDKNAYLFDVNTNFISDTQFAALISNKFFSGGTTNVRDAKFVFQQCYGGGMLNELQNSLGGTNGSFNWVGGSAASWYEPSYSFDDVFTWWTFRLWKELGETNQSL